MVNKERLRTGAGSEEEDRSCWKHRPEALGRFHDHEILMVDVDVDVLRLNEGSLAFTCGILGVLEYRHIS